MSGTYQNLPSNGTFLVLTHGLKCRDLTGVVVGLAQNSIVKALSVKPLPGWAILQNETGWYAPVRDESVHLISVPTRQNGYPHFPPTALADSTVHDKLEVDPIFLVVVEDVVVCDSHGQALAIGSGNVVSIFAHSPTTFAWFHTVNGQIFVADVRHPIKMKPAAQMQGDNGQGALQHAAPHTITPTVQAVNALRGQNEVSMVEATESQAEGPELHGGEVPNPLAPTEIVPRAQTAREEDLPIEQTPAPQPAATPLSEEPPTPQLNAPLNVPIPESIEKRPWPQQTSAILQGGIDYFESHEVHNTFLPVWTPATQPSTPELPQIDENFLRGVQATAQDFVGTNDDFCEYCFSFTIDHAAHCPGINVEDGDVGLRAREVVFGRFGILGDE